MNARPYVQSDLCPCDIVKDAFIVRSVLAALHAHGGCQLVRGIGRDASLRLAVAFS